MLRDITLGQYFPGTSLIHRLDPRLKLVLTIAYIIVLFICKGPVPYAIMTALLLAVIFITRIDIGLIFKSLRPIIILLLFTAVLNVFYSTGGTLLWSLGPLVVTTGGLYNAFFMVFRIILLVSATFVTLTYTTSPIMLTDALESLLSPLKKIKLPVHELSMMMSIALRFIPTLVDETDKIISAQKSRGAQFDSGSLLARARALIPVLVPLFINAFRRAEDLALAMECRCYKGGEGRVRLRTFKFSAADFIALAVTLLIFAVSILLSYTLSWGVMI